MWSVCGSLRTDIFIDAVRSAWRSSVYVELVHSSHAEFHIVGWVRGTVKQVPRILIRGNFIGDSVFHEFNPLLIIRIRSHREGRPNDGYSADSRVGSKELN